MMCIGGYLQIYAFSWFCLNKLCIVSEWSTIYFLYDILNAESIHRSNKKRRMNFSFLLSTHLFTHILLRWFLEFNTLKNNLKFNQIKISSIFPGNTSS